MKYFARLNKNKVFEELEDSKAVYDVFRNDGWLFEMTPEASGRYGRLSESEKTKFLKVSKNFRRVSEAVIEMNGIPVTLSNIHDGIVVKV